MRATPRRGWWAPILILGAGKITWSSLRRRKSTSTKEVTAAMAVVDQSYPTGLRDAGSTPGSASNWKTRGRIWTDVKAGTKAPRSAAGILPRTGIKEDLRHSALQASPARTTWLKTEKPTYLWKIGQNWKQLSKSWTKMKTTLPTAELDKNYVTKRPLGEGYLHKPGENPFSYSFLILTDRETCCTRLHLLLECKCSLCNTRKQRNIWYTTYRRREC